MTLVVLGVILLIFAHLRGRHEAETGSKRSARLEERTASSPEMPSHGSAQGAHTTLNPDQVGGMPATDDAACVMGLMNSLEVALRNGADDSVVEVLVALGNKIRSERPPGGVRAAVVQCIQESKNPRLTGVLVYILGGYAGLPDGLLARVIKSRVVPPEGIPYLAVGGSLGRLPDSWDAQQQVDIWKQLFYMFPYFLPGLLDTYQKENPPDSAFRSGKIPFCGLTNLVTGKTRIVDPATIEAMFAGVMEAGDHAAQGLRELSSVTMDERLVADRVSRALSCTSNPEVRWELLLWLSRLPPTLASQELLRVYTTSGSQEEKLQAGAALIYGDRDSAPSSFRTLWAQATDERVQVGLVQALGNIATNESLPELQQAYEAGSDAVKEAVRQTIEIHLRLCKCDAATRLHAQFGAPATPPGMLIPPVGEGDGRH